MKRVIFHFLLSPKMFFFHTVSFWRHTSWPARYQETRQSTLEENILFNVNVKTNTLLDNWVKMGGSASFCQFQLVDSEGKIALVTCKWLGQTTRKAVFACNAFSKWYSDPLKQSVSGAFCWKAPLWVGWNAADCVARHLRKMPVISEENNNNYFCNQIDQRLVFRLIVSALAAAWSSLRSWRRWQGGGIWIFWDSNGIVPASRQRSIARPSNPLAWSLIGVLR